MRKFLFASVGLLLFLGLLMSALLATGYADNVMALVQPLFDTGLTVAIEDPHPWVS